MKEKGVQGRLEVLEKDVKRKKACKKEKIPYLEPPGFVLQGIFAQFGDRNNGFKARIESKVKERHGKLFKFKLLLLPFHYKGLAGESRKALIRETMEYNGKFHDKLQVKNNEEGKEEIAKIFEKATKILTSLPEQGGQNEK